MTCSSCGREIAENANFCRHCGAAQAVVQPTGVTEPDSAGGAATEVGGTADSTEQLETAVAALQTQVGYLTARVAALESAQSARPSAVSSSPAGSPAAASSPAAPGPAVRPPVSQASPSAVPPVSRPAPASGGGQSVAGAPGGGESSWNWEWLLGGNWLAPHRHPGFDYRRGFLPEIGLR